MSLKSIGLRIESFDHWGMMFWVGAGDFDLSEFWKCTGRIEEEAGADHAHVE